MLEESAYIEKRPENNCDASISYKTGIYTEIRHCKRKAMYVLRLEIIANGNQFNRIVCNCHKNTIERSLKKSCAYKIISSENV